MYHDKHKLYFNNILITGYSKIIYFHYYYIISLFTRIINNNVPTSSKRKIALTDFLPIFISISLRTVVKSKNDNYLNEKSIICQVKKKIDL